LALLEGGRLPTADVVSADKPRIWVLEQREAIAGVIEQGDAIVGVIGLERFGSEALLRSLVVAPEFRNRGIARELVAHVEKIAQTEHIHRLVLLTETAESFFRRLGYTPLDRRQVSEPIKHSAEFRSLCPASATCLAKILGVAKIPAKSPSGGR
jgi:amino-acid N-acetyltransferase